MSKYYIAIKDSTLDSKHPISYKEVQGEPVTIKGFEEIDFFIHKDNKAEHLGKTKWAISEGRTGLMIPYIGATEAYVKDLVALKLKELGLEHVKQVIEESLVNGHSPRYDDKGELAK